MASTYAYRHLIAQNCAPVGAKNLVVLDANGNVVTRLPLGRLAPPTGDPLYRVAIGADGHLWPHAAVAWSPASKLDAALTRAEAESCAMFVLNGDGTQTGFYREQTTDGETTYYIDEGQMSQYADICAAHDIPVYFNPGNHEHYYGKSLSDNMDLWAKYTGRDTISFTVELGDDLFIFCGQPYGTTVLSDEDLQWLYETLEANRNRRCFVFVHSFLPGEAGNPLGFRDNSIFGYWGTTKTSVFKAMISHYKNVKAVISGHSHAKYDAQELDPTANIKLPYVHVPALGPPRQVLADGTFEARDDESYMCIMEAFAGCVVFRGINNITGEPVPIGTYKIDTTLVEIEAGTFTDPTGTIVT